MRQKTLAALLLVPAVAFALFFLALSFSVRRNQERIHAEIRQIVGRSFTAERLELRLWGGLGLTAVEASVAEDTRFAATPMIQAKEVVFKLRWLPALFGRLRVKGLGLKQPEIQIIRNEAGDVNFATWLREREKTLFGELSAGREKSALVITPSTVEIADAKIYYIDRFPKEPVELLLRDAELTLKRSFFSRVLHLELGANSTESPGRNIRFYGSIGGGAAMTDWRRRPLDLEFEFNGPPPWQLARAAPWLMDPKWPAEIGATGSVALEGRIGGALGRPRVQRLVLRGAFFDATEDNFSATAEFEFPATDEPKIRATITADPVEWDRLRRFSLLRPLLAGALDDVRIDGPLGIKADFAGTTEEFVARARLRSDAGIRYGRWAEKAAGTRTEMRLNVRRLKNATIIDESSLAVNRSAVGFSGRIDDAPDYQLELQLKADRFNVGSLRFDAGPLGFYNAAGVASSHLSIRRDHRGRGLHIHGVLSLANVQLTENEGRRKVGKINGRVSFADEKAALDDLSFEIGASKVAMRADWNFADPPTLRYTVRSLKLRLGDLTGSTAGRSDVMEAVDGRGEVDLSGDVPSLRGAFSSAKGLFREIAYRNLRAEIAWRPTRLQVQSLVADALGGAVKTTALWTAEAGERPTLTLQPTLQAVDIKGVVPLILPPWKDHLHGKLTLKASLRGQWTAEARPWQNVEGTGDAEIRDGSLTDSNLIHAALSRLKSLPGVGDMLLSELPERFGALLKRRDTPFKSIKATFKVDPQRLSVTNIALAAEDFAVTGAGWVDFDKKTKWRGVLRLSPEFTQELSRKERNLVYAIDGGGRFSIPFVLEGALPHPELRPDLGGLGQIVQKGILRKGNERAKRRERDE
jgi:hypothetical protein